MWCCKFLTSAQGLESHKRQCSERPRNWKISARTLKTAARLNNAKEQSTLDPVKLGEYTLKNVFNFVYLGHCFQADGDAEHSVLVRMAKARDRFTKLHEVWKSRILSLEVKQSLLIVLISTCCCVDVCPEASAWQRGLGLDPRIASEAEWMECPMCVDFLRSPHSP